MVGIITTYRIDTISKKPKLYDLETIQIMSWHKKDTPYYTLSPYCLRTDGLEENYNSGGIIFENLWQFCKLYATVYDTETYPHNTFRGRPEYLQWKWHNEQHVVNNQIDWPTYLRWRNSGFCNPHPVRYPTGRNHAKECLCSIIIKSNNTTESFTYLQARRKIYGQEYMRLIRKLPEYQQILQKVHSGVSICIQEIDVPTPGKDGYHGSLCRTDGLFIANRDHINKLIDDPSCPCGHGIFLCLALIDDLGL